MPTRIYDYLPVFVEFLREARPTSLLDVGVGYGKLGFIAREILDSASYPQHPFGG